MTSSFDATSPWKALAATEFADAPPRAHATGASSAGPTAPGGWQLRSLAPEADLLRGGFADENGLVAAYERGLLEGRAAADKESDAAGQRAEQWLGAVAARLEEAATVYARDREADVLALGCLVARRLFEHEVTVDAGLVSSLVRQALELAPAESEYQIRLHPDDLAGHEEALAALLPAARPAVVRWIGDASVGRGGVVVETPRRLVDGRVDTALRTLYERWSDA